jgi:PhzF family phenazine biosynthesis protein
MIKVKRVNAFTDSIDGGNPAGVLLESPDLSDQQMAKITKQLAVSETAFVFSSYKADYLVRFFTPTMEVDLCGHATIATFYTMGVEGFFQGDKTTKITQETKAGVFPVDIEFTDDKKVNRVMMTQDKTTLKDIYLDISNIADSLNISKNEIDTSLPKQITSTGLFTLPICITTYNKLKSIRPNFEKIKKICIQHNIGSFHLFTFETIEPDSVYHARNFAPVYGVNEDPVTGTANGAVSSYLFKNKIIQKSKMVCEQGDIMGRPGRIFVEINDDKVKVGGKAKIVEEIEIRQ